MDRMAIGAVRTSHGVRGFLKVRSYSGEYDHFLKLKEVELRFKGKTRFLGIEEVKRHSSGILMKFTGIDNPEEAKKYANWELWVPSELAAPLREGEIYSADLIGCRLEKNGRTLATVSGVIQGGASDLLEVIDTEGKQFLVPFIEQFIGDIDLKAKVIELKAEWLLQ
ncbi:MAG: 16S rRNA processing protein RimM [Spirochaetales bacterium]|nr:16S rRNA processing protein RimM [Spirochaetales bacterium]